MLVPAGFTAGSKQFEGVGAKISGGEMAYAYPYDLRYDDGWTMSTGGNL
jgi:hypothetical protein